MLVRGNAGGGTSTLNVGSGVGVSGGETGLQIDGPATAVTANDLGGMNFSGQSGNYITLSNGAFNGGTLDASGASFEGLTKLGAALTPTEACNAWDAGADVIKIFPAEFFGPAYIKSLKAPFPRMEFLPTGGVTPETVGDFLKAGAFATAAGSALVAPAALKSGDWAAITARAKQFVAAAAAAKV